MTRFLVTIFVLIGVLAGATGAAAAPNPAGDPTAAGHILLCDMNCTACHAATAAQAAWVSPNAAPRLDDVGGRLSPEWIAGYLAAPHNTTAGVRMPDLVGALPEADRPKAV